MSVEPKELGTLIVVVGKAKNLPNKSRFGKQDPFCTVAINEDKQRTKPIKRGGQHPEWDEELRFTIFEDIDDVLVRSESQPDSLSASTSSSLLKDQPGVTTPAALESKSRKGPIKKKGGKSMKVSCFADDAKEPELIGECVVGIDEVLKKGEVDEWYEFLYKEKYSGEVYLELTFYSNNAPPVKRNVPRPAVHGFAHGAYDPTPSSSTSSLSSRQHLSGVATSGSVSGMSLYIPPYAQPARAPSPVGQPMAIPPTSSFAELGLPPGHARRQSLNPTVPGQPSYPPSSISSTASASTLSPHHASRHSIDSLTRPMSSMSIGSSYSSRPLPPASPAPPPVSNMGYSHGATDHRHSLGAPNDAPWASMLSQHQPPASHTPLPRPVSSNDVSPWQQQQRAEDERRAQAATPVPRPVSSQSYAPPQPYGAATPAPFPMHQADPRAASPIPPSLLPAGPPQSHTPRPHATSFSNYDARPTVVNGYLGPSPQPTPPPQSNSAPPSAPPAHYQVPTSSFAGISPADPHRSATPQPPSNPHHQSYDGYQPQQHHQQQHPGYQPGQTTDYNAMPPRSNSLPTAPDRYDPYATPTQPQPPPAPWQASQQDQWRPQPAPPAPASSYQAAPGQPAAPPGGYVPWYMQTQSVQSTPPPHAHQSPPPPVLAQHRPVPNPPAPPKHSVGYYPSDELYASLRQEQQPAQSQPWQAQPQYQPQGYDPQQPPRPPSRNYNNSPLPPQPYSPPAQPQNVPFSPGPQDAASRAPPGWQSTVPAQYGRSPSPNPQGYGRSPSPNPQVQQQGYGRSPSPAPPPPPPRDPYLNSPYPDPQSHQPPPPSNVYPGPSTSQAYPPPAVPPRSPSPLPPPPPKDNLPPSQWQAPPPQSSYPAAPAQTQPGMGHHSSASAGGGSKDWRSYLGSLNSGTTSPQTSGSPSGGGGGGGGGGGYGGAHANGHTGEVRSPSPQPGWYTPPPNLPASIRPPEGWRSTLPVNGDGHQWRP